MPKLTLSHTEITQTINTVLENAVSLGPYSLNLDIDILMISL